MKQIDTELLEKAVVEATGSAAVGKFTTQIFDAALTLQAGLSGEKVHLSMRRHQAEGRRMSAIHLLPYGQMADPADPKRIIPNDNEQQVIQKILQLKQTGMSLRAISRQLTAERITPRMVRRKWKGKYVYCKGKWRHSLIRAIIKRLESSENKIF